MLRRLVVLLLVRAILAQGPAPAVRFRDVAHPSGLRFVLNHAPTPEKRIFESMAGGLATFDYNNDGRTDVFFTNGAARESMQKDSSDYFNRLYRNDGGMKFTDVTTDAGLAGRGFSIAAAVGDFDNDGNADLFVGGVGVNTLYRNSGSGKFQDVTPASGIDDPLWTAAAAWLDYDNDGRLDLWVTHYTPWPPAEDRFCGDRRAGLRVYCHPRFFPGLPNRLYRNLGGGKFEHVSARVGLNSTAMRGMGVAVNDYDRDGFIDVFITNDKGPNALFRNIGGRRFEEVGLAAGIALTDNGKAVSGMGTDFRDFDNDGLPDVVVAALYGETFPLFRNTGKGAFRDSTYSTGMARISTRFSGWGLGFVDFDLDGWKDVFATCSHVNDLIEKFEPTEYRQPNVVFLNKQGKFIDATPASGLALAPPRAHRGLAFADFNADGRIDAVTSSLLEPAEIWENTSATTGDWLIVRLHGMKSNRDGIGAHVRWGDQWNTMTTSVGYASSSHFGAHFGVPRGHAPDTLEVVWPGGKKQIVKSVKPNQVIVVTEEE